MLYYDEASENVLSVREKILAFQFTSHISQAKWLNEWKLQYKQQQFDNYQFNKLKMLDKSTWELVQCKICLEKFNRCYTLFPCQHSFCEACCSDHIFKSKKCLECLGRVEKVVRNHLIDSLIEKMEAIYPQAETESPLDIQEDADKGPYPFEGKDIVIISKP